MPYIDSLDLANRACQHIGNPQILTIDEDSRANFELAFAYDKLRCAELRRNTWRFATKTVVLRPIQASTRLLRPSLWNPTTLYLPGSIVRDENGEFWYSSTPENVNHIPGQSLAWDQYFGPMTVDEWDEDNTYYAGELVYVLGEDSTYVVYLSLTNANAAVPGTAQAYDATVTYSMNDVVSHDGHLWRSLLGFNINNTPATGPALWDANAVYGTLFLVTAQDGFTYASTGENNVGFEPSTDGGAHWTRIGVNAWSRLPALYPSDRNWLPIYGSVEEFYLTSPIGYGPDLSAGQRSLYRLPCNYLREAPRDPKAGSVTLFGAGTGMNYNDWIFQGDYLITRDTGPIMFRFIADITVIARMDDMFCEALAARMALAACEPLSASSQKKRDIANEYSRWVAEARLVNGIEIGAEEPPEDDWIACRA